MAVFNVWNAGTAENKLAGYFFPPHADGRLKVVANVKGFGHWTRYTRNTTKAIPPPIATPHSPKDALPTHNHDAYRIFVKTWLPQFTNKTFTGSHSCSSLTIFDDGWLLGPHPSSPNSLFLATGGNGHTFKNLVNVGKYVKMSMEGTLSDELKGASYWRSGKVKKGPIKTMPNLDEQVLVPDGGSRELCGVYKVT